MTTSADGHASSSRPSRIRSQIRSGKLPTGSRITEAEITETYEVARSTARRTLAVLRDGGLIYTVPQGGSYVR
jgi:DNA-binding GntR family transcriptional regulator